MFRRLIPFATPEDPTMLSTTKLTPQDNASFAVSSRLLSCFVTEGILLAYYMPMPETADVSGAMIILSPAISSPPQRTIVPDDVYCMVFLRNSPVLLEPSPTKYGRRIGLVDPLDMLPGVFELAKDVDLISVCLCFL